MRRIVTWTVVGLVVAAGAWILAGWFTVAGIEQPKYDVTGQKNGYEIRRYGPQLVAETDMRTMGTGDRSVGFRVLAGYIFGGNTAGGSIAMTAPVTMDAPATPPVPGTKPGKPEKIAMTAPVIMSDGASPNGAGNASSSGTMRFVMPSMYKALADLPKPNDPRVRLVEVPARSVAVASFSWFATGGRVAEKSAELMAGLARDKVEVVGRPALASYNPPFTPPFMQRHEIMVEVR